MRVPSRRFTRLLRTAGVWTLSAGVGLALAGAGAPAVSAATRVAVSGGYYWADQPPPLPPPLGQPAGNLPNPTVPVGDWAVAARNGTSNMETFIHLDLSSLPMPGTATGFILHVSEDAGSSGTQTGAVINAVASSEYFGDGAVARPYGEQPAADDGATPVAGQRSATGEWTWDVTAIVTACLTTSNSACGIGLVPGGGTFQANLVGPTAPDDPTGTRHKPYAEGDATASADTGTDSGSGSGTIDSGSGTVDSGTGSFDSGSGSVSTPVETPSSPASVDPINTPLPPAAAAPVTTPPIRRTSTGGTPNKSLPFAFFLAALGVIALLGSFMFTLGEAGDPVVARTGTVFRTLDERLAAASGPKE